MILTCHLNDIYSGKTFETLFECNLMRHYIIVYNMAHVCASTNHLYLGLAKLACQL